MKAITTPRRTGQKSANDAPLAPNIFGRYTHCPIELEDGVFTTDTRSEAAVAGSEAAPRAAQTSPDAPPP